MNELNERIKLETEPDLKLEITFGEKLKLLERVKLICGS